MPFSYATFSPSSLTEHLLPLGQIPKAAIISSCHFNCRPLCLPRCKTLKSSICSFTLHVKMMLTSTKRVLIKSARGKEGSQFFWVTRDIGVILLLCKERGELQHEGWGCLSPGWVWGGVCKGCSVEYIPAKAEEIAS